MNCVRIGGLEAFADDIRIPLKYGVDQCVGDTICAGGILYGQRDIPAMLDFCRDIREVAEPGRAAPQLRQPDGDDDLGRDSSTAASTPSASATACRTATARSPTCSACRFEDVDIVCSGINHQTWYIDIRVKGRQVETRRAARRLRAPPGLLPAGEGPHRRAQALRLLLDRVATATSPSTCPGTASAPTRSCSWIDITDWIHGETGGYLRYSTENRNWFETDFPKFLAEAAKPLTEHKRTDEHASHIIEALETGRTYRGHFNVRNDGIITNLPADCIIESPGFVDRFGINMVEGIDAAARLRRHLLGERQRPAHGVEAAITGDVDAAQAGRPARPARRRHLHPRRGLADGRRDGRRPGRSGSRSTPTPSPPPPSG